MKQYPGIYLVIIPVIVICFSIPVLGAPPVKVFVSILPQKYFAEKIGGRYVDVSVMVMPGASPATFEPRPQQMAAISEADMYFAVGAPFEKAWARKFAGINPRMKIVHTDEDIPKQPIASHTHRGGGGDHDEQHGGEILDPHIWLSPPLVIRQIEKMAGALADFDPGRREYYEDRLKRFKTEIKKLDADIKDILSDIKRRKFIVFHPAWGYFADTYNLEQIPVEMEGKEPKPADLKRLIEFARQNNITTIFVQPQFSSQNAKVVANAIGGEVAPLDPLAESWAENLQNAARSIKKSME